MARTPKKQPAAEAPERLHLALGDFVDVGLAGNNRLKANAVQSFNAAGVTSFKTV